MERDALPGKADIKERAAECNGRDAALRIGCTAQ